MSCVFCDIIEGKLPSDIRWVSSESAIITPLNPHAPGHKLFIPRHHVADGTKRPILAGMVFTRALEYVRNNNLNANVLTSIGEAATQSVMHLHVHVIPRGTNNGVSDGLHPDWPWCRDL